MATIVRSPLYAFRSWQYYPYNAAVYSQPLGCNNNLYLSFGMQAQASLTSTSAVASNATTISNTPTPIARSPLYAFRSWYADPAGVAINAQPNGSPWQLTVNLVTQIPSYLWANPLFPVSSIPYGLTFLGSNAIIHPAFGIQASASFAGAGRFAASAVDHLLGAFSAFSGTGNFSTNATVLHVGTQLGQAVLAGNGGVFALPVVPFRGPIRTRNPLVFRNWYADPAGVAINAQPNGSPWQLTLEYATQIPSYLWANPLFPYYPNTGITLINIAVLSAKQAPASFTGSGNFSATVLPWQASATFTGSGTLSASTTLRLTASASFAGSGQFASTAIPTQLGFSTFTGNGAFSANPYIAQFGQASFTGAGNLTANPYTTLFGQATLTGSGTFAANPYVANFGFANFAGAGFIATYQTPLIVNAGGTIFGGTGRFDIFGASAITWQGNALFIGNGIFTSPPPIIYEAVSATFAGSGAYSINTTLTNTSAATFAGSGAFSPDVAAYQLLTATASPFTGTGSFTPDTAAYSLDTASGSFAGTGTFTPDESATFLLAAEASLQGSGAVSGFVEQLDAANAILAGTGILSASAEQIVATSGTMTGNGTFISNSNFISALNFANYSGSGELAAHAFVQSTDNAAEFDGEGLFTADATHIFAKAKVLKSPGRLRILVSPGRHVPSGSV